MLQLVAVVALAALAVYLVGRGQTVTERTDRTPRGIRNNNPTNIEYNPANDWLGQVGSDGRYVIFSAPVYGIRAAARILDSYRARGVETVRDIVTTWAPPSDNNPTGAYVATVAAIIGRDPGDAIDRRDYPDFIAALIYFENGEQPYSDELIREGVALA